MPVSTPSLRSTQVTEVTATGSPSGTATGLSSPDGAVGVLELGDAHDRWILCGGGKSVHEAFHEVRQPAGQAPPPGALAGLARVRSSWTKLWMIAL
jgi:hypothetical protein